MTIKDYRSKFTTQANDEERQITAAVLRSKIAPLYSGKERKRIINAAARLLNCGKPFLVPDYESGADKVVWRMCRNKLLCPDCATKMAKQHARDDLGRVSLLREEKPNTRLLFGTIKPGEAEDLYAQVSELFRYLKRLLRRRAEPFSRVRGVIAQVHIARGLGGLWRAHLHVIFAVDYEGELRVRDWFSDEVAKVVKGVLLTFHLPHCVQSMAGRLGFVV